MIKMWVKKVMSFCLVGMVLTSCQSWKYKWFQFPIVLRWPVDPEYFKNINRVEAETQLSQHEEMLPKEEQKSPLKNTTEAQPSANTRLISVDTKARRKKDQKGAGAYGKKKSKPSERKKRAQDVIPLL